MPSKEPTRDKAGVAPAGSAAGEGRVPAENQSQRLPATGAAEAPEVAAFVERIKAMMPSTAAGRGRLVFAMDATKSREPTWDMALALQGDMFSAVKEVGTLDVQLVYFRGAGECRASRWVSNPDALARLMATVACHGGRTQIGKVLTHARKEAEARKISALVYVGDAVEEEADDLCARAGELALLGVPVFLFQEGHEPGAACVFAEIARLTRGATCRFDAGSAKALRDLLTAVAVYAAGGQRALLALSKRRGGEGAKLLLTQMKPSG